MTGPQVTDLISAGRLKEADRVSEDGGPWEALTGYFPLMGTTPTEDLSLEGQSPPSQTVETPPPDLSSVSPDETPLPPPGGRPPAPSDTLPPADESPPPSPDERPLQPPELGAAAKDLWTAAKAKAKEVGEKALDGAKDLGTKVREEAEHLQATSQQSQRTMGTDARQVPGLLTSLKDKALDVWRRAPTVVVVSGTGLVLLCSSCCMCSGVFSLLSEPSSITGLENIPVGSDPKRTVDLKESLGISQDKFFQRGRTIDLKSLVGNAGHPLKLVRDEAAIRVWSAGNNTQLAATGPRDNLTGVFVLSMYSPDDTDNRTAVTVILCSVAGILNKHLGSSTTSPPKSKEVNEILTWTKTLMGEKRSGERIVQNFRVGFQNCHPISYQLSIQPLKGEIDPIDVFGLGPTARILVRPDR